MSSRRTRLPDLEPVTCEEAERIPGFRELMDEAGLDTEKNYRARKVVPWDVVGQLLIRVWRDGLEEQRDRIAGEEARKAEERVRKRYERALDRARDALRDPVKREQVGGTRRR